MDIPEKCIVLLSGGIDSSVMLAMAMDMGYRQVYALSFDYGQRHRTELNCAIAQGRTSEGGRTSGDISGPCQNRRLGSYGFQS